MNTIVIPTNENTALPGPADLIFDYFQTRAVKEGFKYLFWNDRCYSIEFGTIREYTGQASLMVLRKFFFQRF